LKPELQRQLAQFSNRGSALRELESTRKLAKKLFEDSQITVFVIEDDGYYSESENRWVCRSINIPMLKASNK
jgi:hypothetical protein